MAIVVTEVLKYLQCFMYYLPSSQNAITRVRENEIGNTQGRQRFNNPLQTNAGVKKIGFESRISIFCSSEINIWWMVLKYNHFNKSLGLWFLHKETYGNNGAFMRLRNFWGTTNTQCFHHIILSQEFAQTVLLSCPNLSRPHALKFYF